MFFLFCFKLGSFRLVKPKWNEISIKWFLCHNKTFWHLIKYINDKGRVLNWMMKEKVDFLFYQSPVFDKSGIECSSNFPVIKMCFEAYRYLEGGESVLVSSMMQWQSQGCKYVGFCSVIIPLLQVWVFIMLYLTAFRFRWCQLKERPLESSCTTSKRHYGKIITPSLNGLYTIDTV